MENIRSNLTWAATPYSILIGTVYLYGYWSSFEIKIFDYVTVSEIIIAALLPSMFAFTVIFAGIMLADEVERTKVRKDTPGNSLTRRPTSNSWLNFLSSLTVLLGLGWIVDFYWLALLAFFYPVAMYLISFPQVKRFNNPFVVVSLAMLILFAPLLAFISAKSSAHTIIIGERFFSTTIDSVEYKFLGHVGGRNFLINRENSKIIILPDGDDGLILHKSTSSTLTEKKKAQIRSLFSW